MVEIVLERMVLTRCAKKVVHPKCIQSILIQSILIIVFNYVARLVQASSSKGGVLKVAHAGKRSIVMQSVNTRFWIFLGLPKTARPPNQRFSRRSIVSGWCGTEESFAKDPEVQLYQLLPRLDQLLQGLHQALEHA